ncbi:MAG TPA: GNAT family N-acetyltransferase [Gammaproteobacteria bacterium]|nr:GNAT family N-acetyltransferase [Gammaproteobacteria bacterium]
MANVQIKYLAEVPQHVQTLAQWSYDAWSQYDPTLTLENSTASFKDKLNKDKLPLTFVAISDNQPVGMVSLKTKIKVGGHEDRDLWLGSYWVVDDYRDQGIGTQLLEKAYSKARELGHKKISLFASDPSAPEWYSKHGWKQFGTDTYQGHTVALMEYIL